MSRPMHSVVLLFLLCPAQLTSEEVKSDAGECKNSAPSGRSLNFSVDRKLNRSDGKWLTTFSASKVDSEPKELNLEVKHKQEECQGRHVMNIEVAIKEISQEQPAEKPDKKLLFHPRHGSNVALLNNGRSVHKLDISVTENSVVFTNRPLMTNEMFEVRLDKRASKLKHCLAIGVMTHSPDDVEMVSSMHRLVSNSTWMYHNNAIYGNSKELVNSYSQDINNLQARDRLGVMHQDDGSIHFFVNGEDQGRAVSSVTQPVYGVFELWHDALKATIVY